MLSASAAPRWNRQMSTLPRELPNVAAPFASSAAKALRRRNDGASPIVTNAIAPDFMNTLRFISMSSRVQRGICTSSALKFRSPKREADDLLQPTELVSTRRERVFTGAQHLTRIRRHL